MMDLHTWPNGNIYHATFGVVHHDKEVEAESRLVHEVDKQINTRTTYHGPPDVYISSIYALY